MNKTKVNLDNNLILKSENVEYNNDTLKNTLDKIIESGSNANGRWIKYSDGSMICYAEITREIKFNTPSGSSYTGETTNSIIFPQQFVTSPRVAINTQNGGDYYYCVVYGFKRNEKSINNIVFLRTSSVDFAVNIPFSYIAIGKWK